MELDLASVLIGAIVGIFPELIAGFFLWKRWFARANQDRLQNSIVEGEFDPAIAAIFRRGVQLMFEPIIDLGEKDEHGKPVLVPPVSVFGREFAKFIYHKFRSGWGTDGQKAELLKGDVAQALQDPSHPFTAQLMTINPKIVERCLRDGDYIPLIIQMFGPMAKSFITEKINTRLGGSSGGWR